MSMLCIVCFVISDLFFVFFGIFDLVLTQLQNVWFHCVLQMFHLMPTPQGSFYVFNDIFRLNYA